MTMPMTDDLQDAVDDLGAQLEAEFAGRTPEPDPVDEPAVAAPRSDGEPEPVPAAGDAPPAEPAAVSSLTLDLNGEQVTIDETHARQLVALQGWAQSLPEETRTQFAAIERGDSVAVPRADFEAFQKWREQAGAGARPAQIDPDDLDPDTAAYVRQLETEAEQLRRAQQSHAQQQLGTEQERAGAAIDEVSARFAEQYGLTPAELGLLHEQTAALQIVPRLLAANSVYSPSGQLIAEPDYATVFTQAFEAGLTANPQLREKLVQSEVARQLATERAANELVDGKRARAASLASVPSAALTRDPQSPRLSNQDTAAAIAAELRKLNGGVES